MQKALLALSLLVAFGACILPAAAQTDALPPMIVTFDSISFDHASHHIVMPRPPFIVTNATPDTLAATVHAVVEGAPGIAAFTILPKGETQQTWRQLAAILLIDKQVAGPDVHVPQVSAGFAQACLPGRSGSEMRQPQNPGGLPILLIWCEQFAPAAGPGLDTMGEMMALTVVETPVSSARVYYEWRGPGFDIDLPQTLPVPSMMSFDGVLKSLAEVTRIELAPAR